VSRRGVGLILLLIVSAAVAASAQDSILELSLDAQAVTIPAGGTADLRLEIINESVREGDDIAPEWNGPAEIAMTADPPVVKVLDPFDRTSIRLTLSVSGDAAPGVFPAAIDVIYTYCIDDLCFQIVETLQLAVTVEPVALDRPDTIPTTEDVQTPTQVVPTGRTPFPWKWVGFGGLAVLLGPALLVSKAKRVRWPVYGVLLVLLGGSLAYGVFENQHEQAQGIGAVLCTSCVGIEEAREPIPHLTDEQIEALQRVDQPFEWVVFYATWCHACPFAEALVELAASYNDLIDYRFVDVETDTTLAEHYGVIRSGRTIVPAILRMDTGRVLFGVEDLESRLIATLEVEE